MTPIVGPAPGAPRRRRTARAAAGLWADGDPSLDGTQETPGNGLRTTNDMAYGLLPRHKLDIVQPAAMRADTPIIVFFYGGHWEHGRKANYALHAACIAQAGAVAVVPNYRLFPRVTYPDFLRDCAAAVAWVQAHPERTGTGSLFLMGHSAGGYNAMMLGLDRKWLDEAGGEPARIAGVIGLAGVYEFLPITKPKLKAIFPDAGPEIEPASHAKAEAPPLLLARGSEDRAVTAHHAQGLAERMKTVGGHVHVVTYEGIDHAGLIRDVAQGVDGSAVLRGIMAFVGNHRR